MKAVSDFQYHHMKTETSSKKIWVSFDDEEISSKFIFFGKHFWTSQNIMLRHFHSAYEFIYIVAGEGSIFSRGIEYQLSSGDILVIEPHTEHEGVAHPENPFELFFMGYDFARRPKALDQAVSDSDQLFLRFYEAYTGKTKLPIIRDHHNIGDILFRLMDEINHRRLCREELVRAYLLEIFVFMIRNIAQSVDMSTLSLSWKDPIEKAKEFMRTHYYKPLTLKDISNHVCLSPFHFSRLFKKETRESPMGYLIDIRIENAKRFMIFSDLSLTEISNMVGFGSIHYFSHSFKKREGRSPLEYRRNRRKMHFLSQMST